MARMVGRIEAARLVGRLYSHPRESCLYFILGTRRVIWRKVEILGLVLEIVSCFLVARVSDNTVSLSCH